MSERTAAPAANADGDRRCNAGTGGSTCSANNATAVAAGCTCQSSPFRRRIRWPFAPEPPPQETAEATKKPFWKFWARN